VDLLDAIEDMRRRIDGEMLPAMLDVAEGVVEDAKTGHPWRNRTGRLESAIRHGGASGSLARGYRVEVVAATKYASYLEYGWEHKRQLWHRDTSGNEVHMGDETGISHWAFLWPAWQRREDWATNVVNEALASAVAY